MYSSENLYNVNDNNSITENTLITGEDIISDSLQEEYEEEYEEQNNEIDELITPNIEWLAYNIDDDIYQEEQSNQYHLLKDSGLWNYAKMIIGNNNKDTIAFTEYFLDYFEPHLTKNNDLFENIQRVYYKSYLDTDIIYDFNNQSIAKYIIENIKISTYKQPGYFGINENHNKWPFTISIITKSGVYTFNRYIAESRIGYS